LRETEAAGDAGKTRVMMNLRIGDERRGSRAAA